MRRFQGNRTRWGAGGLLLGAVLLAGWATAQAVLLNTVKEEDFFPANTFLLAHLGGQSEHAAAYQKTAEYDAFYASGLADLFSRTIEFAVARDGSGNSEKIMKVVDDLMENGFMVGSFLTGQPEMPLPAVVLVFPEAAGWHGEAVALVEQVCRKQGIPVFLVNEEGRKVTQVDLPNTPGYEFGLWKEGNHLVIVMGQNAVQTVVATSVGKHPGISTNARWTEATAQDPDFQAASSVWFDWKALQSAYGHLQVPIPAEEPLTVQDVLKITGLDQFDYFLNHSGYKGRSLWTESFVAGLGNPAGPGLTMADLPPLPVRFNTFMAKEVNVSADYKKLLSLANQVAALAGQQEQLEQFLAQIQQQLGFDLEKDLLDQFGNVLCAYDDINGGLLWMGGAVCISLKDPEKFQQFLSERMDRLAELQENGQAPDWKVYPLRVEKNGQELYVFDFYDDRGGAIQLGGAQVIGNWLVLGIMPQTVEAFRMRHDNELPRWIPHGEYEEALNELPEKFSGITIMNTRENYQLALSLFSSFLPFIQKAALDSNFLQEDETLPFFIEDFPPGERVSLPLFPNVIVSVADEKGTRFVSRASTFGIPFPGGNGGLGAATVTGTMVALLLPAIQQSRAAARESQSKNNMKQLGLALHNYHDVHGFFAQGTFPNENLEPNERLSWAYSILPMIEQAALYENIQRDQAWNSEANELYAGFVIPTFINPGKAGKVSVGYGEIHYVGMAGVGDDAPLLPRGHERAGIFGYNRTTRFRDIIDGTSNTIMITEANADIGPWLQGGSSTIRALTKQPYINGPDGIGSPSRPDRVSVLMADGSVRTVSKNIDPNVMENLVKIADGQVIGEF